MNKVKEGFAKRGVAKSGVNTYTGFDYFTLEDITPPIIELCVEYGITMLPSFTSDLAIMNIFNSDDRDDCLSITVPMVIPEIKAANATQNVGASVTYMRRYLYMVALDIIEADTLDANHGKPVKKAPSTPVQRAEAKAEIVKADKPDGGLRARRVEELAKELMKKNPKAKSYITKISKETSKFTEMTGERAEDLILELTDKLVAADEK